MQHICITLENLEKNTRKIKDNINWYWGLLNMNGYNTHEV